MIKFIQFKNIYFIFFFAFLILIANGLFVLKELRERTIASDWLVHTYLVTSKMQSTFIKFIETQKQLYFYLDTHNKKFLDLYQTGIIDTRKQLAEIKQLTLDSPSQQIKINDLDEEIIKSTLLIHKIPHNLEPFHLSSSIIANDQSVANIKAITKKMIATESSLIKQRTQKLEYQRFLNLIAILLSTFIGYFFIIFAFLTIIKLTKENEIKQLKLLRIKQEKLLLEKSRRLELQKMTTKVNAFLEGAPDALVICDHDGKITYINAMTEKLFGYTRSELMGEKIEILIPSRFGAQHAKHRKTYFKNPHVRPMGIGLNLYARHKDGLEIPVEINLSPIETDNGMGTIAAVRDVTEHKQMQRLIAENEERWKYALESGNQGVWDWYLPEKIIYFSHAWKAMFGYQDDEIQNEQSEFESRVHPEDLPKVWERLKV